MNILWAITTIMLLIIEVYSTAFVAIFFAFGSFFAACLAWYGISLEWQITSFSICSLASLLLLRKFIVNKFNKNTITSNDAHHLTNRHGVITKEIQEPHSMGEVQVAGSFWQATADHALKVGDRVLIVGRHYNHDLILEVSSLK